MNNRATVTTALRKCRKLTLCLIFLILSFFNFSPEGSRVFALSIEEEKTLGREFMATVRNQFNFVDDEFANDYINDLGQYLARHVEIKYFPFRFLIIKDGRLNAFAAPGGNIFIFSGLVQVMNGIDELAAVICHEIAHVSARHLAQRIDQGKKIGLATMAGVLTGALIGGKAGGAAMAGSVAAGIQTQLHYSREDERQADQVGFKYMDLAGFDPSGMITTLNTIQRGNLVGSDQMPAYLLTHPTGPERMSNLDSLLTGYSRKNGNREASKLRADFPLFQAVIRARCSALGDAENLFKRELEKNPASTQAHFGLGIVWTERSDYDLAVDHLRKALKEAPESLPILKKLAAAYQLDGKDAEAIPVLEKALKIDDRDTSTLFLLAKGYQDLEEHSKAIRLYEKLMTMKPVRDEVYYNLGVSYGREGRLGLAHYNFGIYFKERGNMDKAKFHFKKAGEFSKSDPVLRDRIQGAMEDLPLK